MITRLGVDVNLRCRNRRGLILNRICYLLVLTITPEKGGTVLHVAARHGQLEMVRFILQLRQVEVDALDDRGKTVRSSADWIPFCINMARASLPLEAHLGG